MIPIEADHGRMALLLTGIVSGLIALALVGVARRAARFGYRDRVRWACGWAAAFIALACLSAFGAFVLGVWPPGGGR